MMTDRVSELEQMNYNLGRRLDAYESAARPFADACTEDGDEYDGLPDDTIIKIECTVADLKALRNAINGDDPAPAEIIVFRTPK